MTTTKKCPNCASTYVVPLTSINRKICDDCKHVFEWHLSPGQKGIFSGSKTMVE